MQLLALLGPLFGLVGFIALIWLIVVAFKRSVGWGLAVLFIPFAFIFFAVKNWEESRKPFLIYTGCVVANIMVMVLSFKAMGGFETAAMVHKASTGEVSDREMTAFVDKQMSRMEHSGMLSDADEAEIRKMRQQLRDDMQQGRVPAGNQSVPIRKAKATTSSPTQQVRIDGTPLSNDWAKLPGATGKKGKTPSRRYPGSPNPNGYVTISFREAPRFLGERVIWTDTNGREHRGHLAEVRPEVIVFERYVQAGTFSVQFDKRDIQSLEVIYR